MLLKSQLIQILHIRRHLKTWYLKTEQLLAGAVMPVAAGLAGKTWKVLPSGLVCLDRHDTTQWDPQRRFVVDDL